MPVYTIHTPLKVGSDTPAAAERLVFVRDGFHFWAFVAAPLWLAWHRLWWALLGYLAVSVAGAIVLSAIDAGAGVRLAVMVLFALLMGFEAATLRRWTLSRGSWRQVDVITGDNREIAERRFFDHWTASRGAAVGASGRGVPPSFTRAPSGSYEAIIGLFPQPGAGR